MSQQECKGLVSGNRNDGEQSREDDDQEVVEIEDEKNGPKDRVRVMRDA